MAVKMEIWDTRLRTSLTDEQLSADFIPNAGDYLYVSSGGKAEVVEVDRRVFTYANDGELVLVRVVVKDKRPDPNQVDYYVD
jgi:hypothetical protein